MSRLGVRRVAFAACFVSAVWACTLVNPLDEYGPSKGKPLKDAAVADVSAEADGASCSGRWPDAPKDEDATGSLELVFAADTLNLIPGAGEPGGYNLDGNCTCPGPPSCKPPAGARDQCDDPDGVDQAGTKLIASLLTVSGLQENASTLIREGNHGVLFRVQQYNGGMNDTQVFLSIFQSNGTETDTVTGKPKALRHDGTDVWTLDPGSVSGGGSKGPPYIPLVIDAKAYVTNGVLVAKLDVPLDLSKLLVNLRNAVVTAKIEHTGSTYRLTGGRLSGRWPSASLLKAFDTLKAPGGGDEGVCGSNAFYQALKGQICLAVDLATDARQDNMDAECDAVGTTVLFTAEAATLGPVLAGGTPDPHLCGDSWLDSCAPR